MKVFRLVFEVAVEDPNPFDYGNDHSDWYRGVAKTQAGLEALTQAMYELEFLVPDEHLVSISAEAIDA